MDHPDHMDHDVTNSILEALPHSNCLIISHENVSEAFPFNKFGSILEYGGSSSSSRICNISAKLIPLPHVHFLKVKLEDHRVLEALCEGSIFQKPEYMVGVGSKEVVELINFLPTKENSYIASSESATKADAIHDTESASSRPYTNPDTVIIVNTQNFEKEMLVSRRSSYQKILRMEKVGVQVVEREVDLPLDLIFTAAVCLVWYDARNVRITTATTEEASYIAKFMETLAANILMAVNFAFSSCILVFEGESAFLSSIMEFSDTLYAAAASLNMHLQLFCSYSPESTDEIVLNCINSNIKLNKGLYPAMLESETLAESFLVKFPSINTLSAQAILSSCGMLVEFLQWSFEQRIQAIGKYHVPDESLALFNALCRYGELGESKSGTTECSSIESDVNSGKAQSQYKRQKCKGTYDIDIVDLTMDDFFYVGPQNKPDDNILTSTKGSPPFQTRNIFTIEGMLKKTGKHKHSNSDKTFSDKYINPSVTSNLDWTKTEGHKHVHEDLNGEVINWNFNFPDEGFQSVENCASFTRMPDFRSEPMTISSQLASRREYSSASRVFLPFVEINCDDVWTNSKHHDKTLEENITGRNDTSSKGNISSWDRYGGFVRENDAHDHMRNMLRSPVQQKSMPNYGGTLFSNPNQATRLQECSPWTIDLLNKIKEKSKMHQKSLQCSTRLSCPGSSRSRDKNCLSRSPSIINSYRYQGASRLKKMPRQKWQKMGNSLCSSNNEKKAPSVPVPTWTPIDKRARLNLSFARNGHEKQSKLVWMKKNLPTADCNLRKRLLDES